MGEIAEMMINGEMCECCGVFLDGEASGYPRYCSKECASDRGVDFENKTPGKKKDPFPMVDEFVEDILDFFEENVGGKFNIPIREHMFSALKGMLKHCHVQGGIICHEPIEKTLLNNLKQKENNKRKKSHAKKLDHNR